MDSQEFPPWSPWQPDQDSIYVYLHMRMFSEYGGDKKKGGQSLEFMRILYNFMENLEKIFTV